MTTYAPENTIIICHLRQQNKWSIQQNGLVLFDVQQDDAQRGRQGNGGQQQQKQRREAHTSQQTIAQAEVMIGSFGCQATAQALTIGVAQQLAQGVAPMIVEDDD